MAAASGSTIISTCRVRSAADTARAWGSSSTISSAKPTENVRTGWVMRFIMATTVLESTPPLRKAPTGTSAVMHRRVASSRSSSSCSIASCSVYFTLFRNDRRQ